MIKPILFNTDMVRATLDGYKNTTRRICKGDKPPCEVGDLLWVRETWDFLPCITCMERDCLLKPAVYEDAEAITEGCWLYRADSLNALIMNCHNWRPSIHMPKQAARIFLRVTEVSAQRLRESINGVKKPAKALRDEGIQIYEACENCIRSGAERTCPCSKGVAAAENILDQPRWEFAQLWDSTIPKGRLARDGWEANPWVWVIRFERCERPEGWPGT